jgi:hypothetical protein
MELYRYLGTHGYESLRDKKLKVAAISTFNDPFEFLYRQERPMTLKLARDFLKSKENSNSFYIGLSSHQPNIKSRKDYLKLLRSDEYAELILENFDRIVVESLGRRDVALDKLLRVLCFSRKDVTPLEEILLWSHYANSHRGIRVAIDIPEAASSTMYLKEVLYNEHRVPIDFTSLDIGASIDAAIKEAVRVKSKAWEYEREFRLFIFPHACQAGTTPAEKGLLFYPFEVATVKGVDLGVRYADAEKKQMADLMMSCFPCATLRQATFHPQDYSLVYSAV